MSKITAILGTQWGDEGKGKIIDVLSENYDIVARFQGGNNAGHTVIMGDQNFILHIVPTGILRKDTVCMLCNGVVIDPIFLSNEIKELMEMGIKFDGRFEISSKSHLVFTYHKLLDKFLEGKMLLGKKLKVGTTLRGIGPAYTDKIARKSINAAYLLNYDKLKEHFLYEVEYYNKLYNLDINLNNELDLLKSACKFLSPYISDTMINLNKAILDDKNILFEGAQGALLDIDHGTYPYVTSNNTTIGGVFTGSGISPKHLDNIIGVTKAYCTRVGRGPFPTQLKEDENKMRALGNEYGSTTGRERRCGWFDAVASKYSCMINGIEQLVITKLDVLDSYDEINICVAYKIDGEYINHMPLNIEDISKAIPVYEKLPGWNTKTSHIRNFYDLPKNAINYLNYISHLLNVELFAVSIGSDRSEIIFI